MNNLFDLNGRVAIVTGASRGIGRAIAEALADYGATVVISSRRQDSLDEVTADMKQASRNAVPIAAHVGEKESLHALVDQTMDQLGRIDILVNNAATNPHFGPILESEDSMWQKTLEVNIMGNFWLCQKVVPIMREQGGGKIINIASIVGISPGNFQGIYSITKAGVISLTQTLAMELGADNIQVNAIAPGLVQTKFARAIWENDTLLDMVQQRTPVGRIGQPEEIASLVVWLASGSSGFATGGVFVVDGGVTVGSL